MSLKIKNNLITGAEVELSPNSSDRHDEIDLIVLHCISLPEGQYANNYPKDLFLNKLDFKNTIKEILNKFEIEDLHITEPPIDEVIGKILLNKK